MAGLIYRRGVTHGRRSCVAALLLLMILLSPSVSVAAGFRDPGVGQELAVGSRPSALVFDPSNNYTYVADSASEMLSVVSGSHVVANITLGFQPGVLGYDPEDKEVYVANPLSNTVAVITGTAVTISLTVGAGPSVFAFDQSDGYMYVSDRGSGYSHGDIWDERRL